MAESRDLIWRYYLYQTTNSAGFYLPISILYLQHRGFGLAFVALTQATFTVAMVAVATAGWFQERLGTRAVFALLAPVYGWPTPASRSPRSCWSPSSS
jgi:hypothetical protein